MADTNQVNEGVASIQARINAIEQRFGAQRPQEAQQSTLMSTPAPAATDFAGLLQRATAARATDSSQYPNGRIPDSALASIGGGHRLTPAAATAYLQMKADAAKAGVSFGVNDSYRSYDEQVKMAREKGLYSQGGLAAKPGTSDHGRGLSLDLELDGKSQQWLKANAKKYGFVNDVHGESWHWTYKPAN